MSLRFTDDRGAGPADASGVEVIRFIPIPKSVSVGAQQYLAMGLAFGGGDRPKRPAPDDLEGWRARTKAANDGVAGTSAGHHDLTDPYLSPLFGDFTPPFPPTLLQAER